MCQRARLPVPCGYAVPQPALLLPAYTVPCCPPRGDPAGRGPETVPGCSVGTSQGETRSVVCSIVERPGLRLHPGLLPPDTATPCACGRHCPPVLSPPFSMPSLCRRQALCRQTVQLESRFMEPGLGGGPGRAGWCPGESGGSLRSSSMAGRCRRWARACDRAVGPGSPWVPGL